MQDEAASVRQAAVDLLGSHIGTRRDLALSYFDTLVTASRDTSTSVYPHLKAHGILGSSSHSHLMFCSGSACVLAKPE